MKKMMIVFVVAVLAVSSAFAGGLSLGIMQNYMDTSIVVDFDMGRFGIEGSVGLPLVPGAVEIVDYYTGDKVDSEGNPVDPPNPAEVLLIPGAMANVYWKAIDTKAFGLRLGIQADAVGISDEKGLSVVGLWGASVGLEFKFGGNLSMNLTGTVPAAMVASALGAEDAGFTAFYYTTKEESDWDVLLILPAIVNEFVRLSFKWSI